MKAGKIVALILAGLLFVAGLGLVIVGANGVIENKELDQYAEIIARTMPIQGEIHAVSVQSSLTNVRFVRSEDESSSVSYMESFLSDWSIKSENGTLVIRQKQRIPFVGDILSLVSGWNEVVITVPRSLKSITVNGAASDVIIPIGFSLDSLDVSVASGDLLLESNASHVEFSSASGDVTIRNAEVGSLTADTASGDIMLADMTGSSVHADTASGDIMLSDVVLSGQFYADTASGDIILTRSDAGSLDIDTTSGEVNLNLLYGKQFQTDTTSGSVRVPSSTGTQICKIDTTSGNITVTVE